MKVTTSAVQTLSLLWIAGVSCGPILAAAWPPAVPPSLILTVRETAGIARSNEVVRSGVPLPHSLNIRSASVLTLVDAGGTPVPAEFGVLARWNAGRGADAPIQWLLVTFPATVGANAAAAYRVVTDGSTGPNPAPAAPLTLTQAGNQITVNTGAALFRLGAAGTLFDEVRASDGARVINGGSMTAHVNGANSRHGVVRRVSIEHVGPLIAIVVIEGAYDMAAVGGGGLASRRRYVFTAGSPTVIVRHSVNWEGDKCSAGVIACAGSPNGLRVRQIRDSLALDLGSPLSVTAIGSFSMAGVQATVSAGQTAWVRQQLRTSRSAPLSFTVSVPGATGSTGQKADGGMLSTSGAEGTVAVALNHLHRYEPQALRILDNGQLALDLADDQVWIGARQGLFATLAVAALAATPSRAALNQILWAPLNRPLRAWAQPAWFAASEALDEFPVGSLPAEFADYDTLVSSVLAKTAQEIDHVGLSGLMTYGIYPRLWGNPIYGNETDCEDPTDPSESWDNLYWCSTWTDYHNTVAAAPNWAFRTGEVEWLDEIATPAALRTLHTQIFQCAPADAYFYCGQAPAGYGGYRSDFNSSHAYFDNLFLYYWLTGDYTVVETVKSGASSMRDFLCGRRPAAPCLPDDPPLDPYAGLEGRVASQWFAAFRFVGLAGDDASYLDDYRSGLARAVTQYYVEAEQAGIRYGFWLSDRVGSSATTSTDQLWMATLYDMNMLFRLQRDTADVPIGNPAIPPSQVLAAWARTLVGFGATVSGDATGAGPWPNALNVTWAGPRIGGTLIRVTANLTGGDPFLYDTGKAALTALLVRAGQQTGDAVLTQMGADLTRLEISTAMADGSPLGKIMGEFLSRMPAAVGRLAASAKALPRRRP